MIARRIKRRKRRAMTLLEITIASALAVIVATAVMSIMLITARVQSKGVIEQRVFEYADRLQDRIIRLLQAASREAGVFYSDPNGAYYHHIVFREGVGLANQELVFDPDNKTLTYDPDISIDDNETILGFGDDNIARLVDVRFRSAMKTGGIPDSAVILVLIKVTDLGKANIVHRDPGVEANWITSTRSFAVNLRRL